MNRVLKSGACAHPPFALEVTAESAGWDYSGLRILALHPGQGETFGTADTEVIVISLSGSADVTVDDQIFELEGREHVFAGVSDAVYAPRDTDVRVASAGGGRFALASAKCDRRLDEERDGETALEEIYCFEVADGPSGPGIGFQRVYAAANAASLGADVLSTSSIDDFRAAVLKAKASTRTTVIHVETHPLVPAPETPAWWDVPVAEISSLTSTQDARVVYEEHKPHQRTHLAPPYEKEPS